jgi:peptidoglycan/xylan/chitin deacetylase (PgdA/CDA1 family)
MHQVALALPPAVILTYHEIVPVECSYRYVLTCERLAEHFAVLNRVCPGNGQADPGLITFDDGHASHYRYAFPLLERYGRKAVFFVTAAHVDERAEAVTGSQLREMASHGHAIESHGWSHRFLTSCSDAELRQEMERSKKTLEDRLGMPVRAIAAPGGRCDGRVLASAAAAGYERFYDSNPWRARRRSHGIDYVGRFMAHRHLDARGLENVLHTRGWQRLRKRFAGAVKAGVKSTLGDHLYHSLWCRLSAEEERREINREYE